jgi:hypothetical protein
MWLVHQWLTLFRLSSPVPLSGQESCTVRRTVSARFVSTTSCEGIPQVLSDPATDASPSPIIPAILSIPLSSRTCTTDLFCTRAFSSQNASRDYAIRHPVLKLTTTFLLHNPILLSLPELSTRTDCPLTAVSPKGPRTPVLLFDANSPSLNPLSSSPPRPASALLVPRGHRTTEP